VIKRIVGTERKKLKRLFKKKQVENGYQNEGVRGGVRPLSLFGKES
jgi:hypothetical protein